MAVALSNHFLFKVEHSLGRLDHNKIKTSEVWQQFETIRVSQNKVKSNLLPAPVTSSPSRGWHRFSPSVLCTAFSLFFKIEWCHICSTHILHTSFTYASTAKRFYSPFSKLGFILIGAKSCVQSDRTEFSIPKETGHCFESRDIFY